MDFQEILFTLTATLRAFSTALLTGSPTVRVGSNAAEYARVVAASPLGAPVCKFCLKSGHAELSPLPCSRCGLTACLSCDFRSHIAPCARCLMCFCATCIVAAPGATLGPCGTCALFVCTTPCPPNGLLVPCVCPR